MTTDEHTPRPFPNIKPKHRRDVDVRQKGDDVLERQSNAALPSDFNHCLRIPTILSMKTADVPD